MAHGRCRAVIATQVSSLIACKTRAQQASPPSTYPRAHRTEPRLNPGVLTKTNGY
ncbi:hypothetical protein M440DRAFT_1399364 [Trichoderma longibrachiatum ATCC 18648]|uniref:Uncharacterized protein n=1 Tax=Trichoderma longibrachiatum ATCC 18648 TaxID=983965 RepID=A0A2T4C9I8_TRILO|nr:hypothetical protein M440DRAFT_1399364 [Trichoderma longibrachiatum ATCC 18648]